jgi:ubiquinone/menaquinone biosynthesis C-methylase UbiE
MSYYDRGAPRYDLRMRRLGLRLGIWEGAFMQTKSRQRLVDRLNLEPGFSVLETGTGTGIALPCIARGIGQSGELHACDLSSGMLEVARRKMQAKKVQVEFTQANASYLPYRSGTFDAVMHFGGWNTFADKGRALAEMHRVAKAGAKIVLSDEGLSLDRQDTRMGRRLIEREAEYASALPVDLIPDLSGELEVYWLWRGIYWVVEFNKTGPGDPYEQRVPMQL